MGHARLVLAAVRALCDGGEFKTKHRAETRRGLPSTTRAVAARQRIPRCARIETPCDRAIGGVLARRALALVELGAQSSRARATRYPRGKNGAVGEGGQAWTQDGPTATPMISPCAPNSQDACVHKCGVVVIVSARAPRHSTAKEPN